MNDMNAQNAAESDKTKPAVSASPPRDKNDNKPTSADERPQKKPVTAPGSKSPTAVKRSLPGKDPRPKPSGPETDDVSPRTQDAPDDRDSDAETIVLPGKDGHSPSKVRKVRQEDKSESDGDTGERRDRPGRDADLNAASTSSGRTGGSVKRTSLTPHPSADRDRRPRLRDGSSGLSSAPGSPPRHARRHSRSGKPRGAEDRVSSASDSEHSWRQKSAPKQTSREKHKSGDQLSSTKRNELKVESDDDNIEGRKSRSHRTTSGGFEGARASRDHRSAALRDRDEHRHPSKSPPPRLHRRSASSQLPSNSTGGLGQKKKRLPPPLHATEDMSDESSASGSPHPRTTKLRTLTTSAGTDSNASPVKMGPHKKHLDAHGQTLLARACARGEYEVAKQRLGERPEDLNVADYAGNTPLQIAAINGCEDIVKLLIDAGCNTDCVNYDKDTPLLDAVDNGHLNVVKLLLDAGVNPRKANMNGEEPIDRVTEDTDNADDIRTVLMEARKRAGERRRTSEERASHLDPHDARDSHNPDSPRHSPAATGANAHGRRGGTVRATKTRNDLLYMPLDEKTLRQAAGRGDMETVARILQVKEGVDDPESMVAAARGGHDLVMELLLGLGTMNPDPDPVPSMAREFSTPILAAIGQENIKIVALLLTQQRFDPTKRFRGDTYYEIARARQGTNWKEEEDMLRKAYDESKRPRKDSAKTKSPARREEKRARRDESSKEDRSHRRKATSPSRETENKKRSPSKLSSAREKRRSNSFSNTNDDRLAKRAANRTMKDDRLSAINASDREASPTLSQKIQKTKRSESDVAAMSSEGETSKPRRKLVSKGELSRERERQRRSSIASNASSRKEPASPRESRNEELHDKGKLSEKYHDRAKALKRDESADQSASSGGDGTAKRHRTSVTPDRPDNNAVDKDDGEAPVKRRRLDSHSQERRPKRQSLVESQSDKSSNRGAPAKASAHKGRENSPAGERSRRDSGRRESGRSTASDKSIHVKSEDVDVEMPDVERAPVANTSTAHDGDAQMKDPPEDEQAANAKALAAEEEAARKKAAEEERRAAEEERKKREAEEQRRREVEDEERRKKQKAEEEARLKREKEEKRQRDEEEKRRREEAEAEKLREQQERERREAEEARRKKEEEEAEAKRRAEEEEKRKKEEEEKRKREEEERVQREQLEREAAERARREREEEERKERERRERLHKEEMERKRAAREAEQRRIREEQELARLDKLPALLRWLDTSANPKSPSYAEKFSHVQGVRYDTIRPEANQTAEGREQWLLNTDAALLLGEKDLDLSRYTAWDRVPVSQLAKKTLWRTEWMRYALTSEVMWDLGRQLPGYYADEDPATMRFQTKERLKLEAWERFLNLDMFFLRVSDFMYTVPNIPHLKGITIAVEYRELLENEAQPVGWRSTQKWKQDPDASRFNGFAPRHKYYYNGVLVGEEKPTLHQTSKTPFPEKRVPRRGLIQVFPNDPDYVRICLEQGLDDLIKDRTSPLIANGPVPSLAQQSPSPAVQTMVNGANGHNGLHLADASHSSNGGHVNGVNGGS